jgi:hypothetical protein
MTDKKKSSDKKHDVSDEAKRSKKQKWLRQQNEEKTIFEDMVDEMLEDEEIYQILKRLKD